MNKRAGAQSQKQSYWKRHPHLKHWLIGIGVVVLLLVCLGLFFGLKDSIRQSKLAPFYDTAGLQTTGPLGEIVRSEPMDLQIDGGTATRVLYRTQKADGSNTFSSGMIFVPNTPGANRPVVAWAHGTLGMGDKCAPTRAKDPMDNLPWVSDMLKNGWIVTATDYAGLGTPGTQAYLVGEVEAQDVLNSVRAARNLPGSNAGSSFVVFGHSQGGHSALFTAKLAGQYAPELALKGTIAAAPAAEITTMLDGQQNNLLDWVIGPEILEAWPSVNTQLSADEVASPVGKKAYKKIADKCIADALLAGLIRNDLKQTFFDKNPADVPSWKAMAADQNAPILEPDQPLLVAESTADTVIAPAATALYIEKSCQAKANITTLWIANTPHMTIPQIISPQAIAWINDRFVGNPNLITCFQKQPVQPLAEE